MKPILIEEKIPRSKRKRKHLIRKWINAYKKIQRVKAFGRLRLEVKAKWNRQERLARKKIYAETNLTGKARQAYDNFNFTVEDQYGYPSNSDSTVEMLFSHIYHKSLDIALWEKAQDNIETFDTITGRFPGHRFPPPPPPPRIIREG